MKCNYCENQATKNVVWLFDKQMQPARITLPWCGCDLHQALIKKWGSAFPVYEGKHYEVEPLTKPVLGGLFRDNPETPEGKYLCTRRDGTVVEWPSFVLGARDRAASWALWLYGIMGLFFGYNRAYCRACRRESWKWVEYRKTHGSGDPDKGKHRKDDPETIAKMKKGKSA